MTYADMITLLMTLFMVLFAISSVNTSKFQALSKALQNAFSGRILSGGRAVMQTGSDTPPNRAAAQPPLPSLGDVEKALPDLSQPNLPSTPAPPSPKDTGSLLDFLLGR